MLDKSKSVDFDTILDEVGSFGLYQKLVICSVLLPAALPCAFHAYSQLFIAATPGHWCRVPELEPWVHDYPDLVRNLSIPFERRENSLRYAECKMYARNYSGIVRYLESKSPFELRQESILRDFGDPRLSDIIECQNGWNYDKSVFPSTVVMEWDLVCRESFYVTLALVLFGVGGLIGNYIFGYLQDIWGRRPSFYVYLILEIASCTFSAFSWDYKSWLVMRVIVGLTVPAILASPYVLAIELVGPDKRVFCTIVSNLAYSLGLVLLSGVIYVVRDWRYLSMAVSLPLLMLFSCYFVLPESPRWLIAVGKYKRATKILKGIARLNGRLVPSDYEKYLRENLSPNRQATEKHSSSSFGIFDLFRTPNVRKKTLIITLIWFANTCTYVGTTYYAPALGGDEIWNFFLAGAVELPTYLIIWPGLNFFGRRWILCLSMLIGGSACMATFLFQRDPAVMLMLYCVGKMGISSAFVVLPLIASEIYPTVVRGLGMSFSSVIAMIGPIVIPLVNYTGTHMLVLPLIVMGALLTVGGIASLFLPETRGMSLPQTLADGENVPLTGIFDYCRPSKKPIVLNPICSICKAEIPTL